MLLPMYLIIAVWGGPRKDYASIKFFLYTLIGSVFLLVAIIALYIKTGTFFIPDLMGAELRVHVPDVGISCLCTRVCHQDTNVSASTWLPAAHVHICTFA